MPPAARADSAQIPPLGPGDVLRFELIGAEPQSRRVGIDADGTIQLPIFGNVRAEGRSLPELRQALQAEAPEHSFPVRNADGSEFWVAVRSEDVMLDIDAYRPVYVDGDVGTPGEIAYRPRMSVRAALAVAGGLGRIGLRDEQKGLLKLDLPTRIAALDSEIGVQRARLAQIDAALALWPDTTGAAIPVMTGGDTEGWAGQALSALRASNASHQDILTELRAHEAALNAQFASEQQAVALDEAEVARIDGLTKRGLTTTDAAVEARRALNMSTTRRLDTGAELSRVQVDIAQLAGRQRDEANSLRRELLQQADTLRPELARMQTERAGLADQLRALGGAVGGNSTVAVLLYRGGALLAGADLATELWPGDVVEVRVTSAPEASQ